MPCEGKVDATILIGAYDSGRGGQFGLRSDRHASDRF